MLAHVVYLGGLGVPSLLEAVRTVGVGTQAHRTPAPHRVTPAGDPVPPPYGVVLTSMLLLDCMGRTVPTGHLLWTPYGTAEGEGKGRHTGTRLRSRTITRISALASPTGAGDPNPVCNQLYSNKIR